MIDDMHAQSAPHMGVAIGNNLEAGIRRMRRDDETHTRRKWTLCEVHKDYEKDDITKVITGADRDLQAVEVLGVLPKKASAAHAERT